MAFEVRQVVERQVFGLRQSGFRSKSDETLHFYEKAGFQRGVKTRSIAYPKE